MDSLERVRNITDLARLAGVSPGTVSRALADSHLIAKKTRDRIQAIAREHEFRPNVMARNLRIKRTGAIGVLLAFDPKAGPQFSAEQSISMLGHLTDQLAARGHDLLLSRISSNNPDGLKSVTGSGRVDGVIAIGETDLLDMVENLAPRDLPLVAWAANSSGQIYFSANPDEVANGDIVSDKDIASVPKTGTRISIMNHDMEAGARQLVDLLFRRIAGGSASPVASNAQMEPA